MKSQLMLRHRLQLRDEYIRLNGGYARMSRPSAHEGRKKREEKEEKLPIAELTGHAVQKMKIFKENQSKKS